MKILVTGGSGFIGSALANSFLEKWHKVTIFDNFSNSSEQKISQLLEKGVTLVKGDITDSKSLENALVGFETVIHLAAQIDVQESILNPEFTYKVNVQGTVNLLNSCVKNKVQNVIGASTAAVYGLPERLPISERTPLNPISPYGKSKVEMEQYIEKFSNEHKLNCVSLRVFNVYGKGQTKAYAGVIIKFLQNINEGQPLVIFGNGSFTRDFIAVEDVANAIQKATHNLKGKRGKCYNIATGKTTSIQELAKLMLEISGKSLEIKHEPIKEGDIPHSQADIHLAQKELGFSPKISLKDGLKKLLDQA